MWLKLSMSVGLALMCLPAYADWVDVIQGDTHPNCLWQGKAPVPGKNIPKTSKVYPFTYSNNDKRMTSYVVRNGKIVYELPVVPVAPVAPPAPAELTPDATAFQVAIMKDTNISDATKLLLSTYFPTIKDNQGNADILVPLWTAIVNTGKLSATEISLIKSYAVINRVPFVAPKGVNNGTGIRPRAIRHSVTASRPGRQTARVLGRS